MEGVRIMIVYDIIIIGSGPAGMTAALYALRYQTKVLLLEKGMPGGKLNVYHKLENYPGVYKISAQELGLEMYEQLKSQGIEPTYGDVISVRHDEGQFKVVTDVDTYGSKAVIIASGTSDQKMNIPGEQELLGRGISFCASCDGSFFKGQSVAVVGNNSLAVEETIFLADMVKDVTFFVEGNSLKANQVLLDQLKQKLNVHLVYEAKPIKVIGETQVESILVQTNEIESYPVKAVFPFMGMVPNTAFLSFPEIKDSQGFIYVDGFMQTSIPGLFAIGDVQVKNLRQIVTATGEGAKAAFMAARLVKNVDQILNEEIE
jgi:thioredoxin reductase (NADPH)